MALPQGSQCPSSATHPPLPPAAGDSPSRAAPAGASSQGRRDDPLYETDLFRIHCFKVLPCGKRYAHDWMRCPFRHPGEKAARRPLNESSWYSATMCPDLHGTTCPRGDACGFAHNVFEHWLHPDRYRTQLCRDGAACSRRVCFFAHSIQQLRTPTGRVIAAVDSAEAEAAAAMVAAAGWAVPGAGGNDAGASGLMADGPLLDSAYPRPLADMIVYTPLHGSGTAPAPAPYTAGSSFGIGATLLSSSGHSGLHQTAAGLLGSAAMTTAAAPLSRHTSAGSASAAGWPVTSAGLGESSIADVFQALMLDASDKQARAEAAAAAATRAMAAADEAAALIGHMNLVGPPAPAGSDTGSGNCSSSEIAALAPCLVDMGCYETRGVASFAAPAGRPMQMTHLYDSLINRHPMSASCSALMGPSVPATAPLAAGNDGSPIVSTTGLSGAGGAPLLRFLSGDQSLAAVGAEAVAALTAPLAGSPPWMGPSCSRALSLAPRLCCLARPDDMGRAPYCQPLTFFSGVATLRARDIPLMIIAPCDVST